MCPQNRSSVPPKILFSVKMTPLSQAVFPEVKSLCRVCQHPVVPHTFSQTRWEKRAALAGGWSLCCTVYFYVLVLMSSLVHDVLHVWSGPPQARL